MNSELVIGFVNTAGFGPDREDLQTPGQLRDWLTGQGLEPGARVTATDLEEARAVREALRDLLSAHNEVATDVPRATAVLDNAAQRSGLAIRFADGLAHAEPSAHGVPGSLGRILAEVSAGMADGTWERLKACRADDCRWAFLDTAKNRSRAWCSMQSCGNRAKVAAYRERHTA
ncbi:MAG TPA: CGNR zinc finger domain-containing protein [Gaiellaceae bacterium]|nr:CGNR zinc finger domain-containing protein [Gaiellaceae bacterium]